MSLEAASERMKIEMMSEEGDDDERKAKDKGVRRKEKENDEGISHNLMHFTHSS